MNTLARVFCCVYVCLMAAVGVYARQLEANNQFLENVKQLESADSLEAFTYAYLDEFLKKPTFERMTVLNSFDSRIWRRPSSKSEALALTILYSNKGYYQLNFSQIEQAIASYERAWSYYQQYHPGDYDIIEYCLKPLGNAYSMIGDYESAESIIKSYLLMAGAQKNIEQQVSALINLSIVYHDTGRFAEAIDMLNRALEFHYPEKIGLIHSNKSKNQIKLGELKNARQSGKTAMRYFKKMPDKSFLANTYATLALIELMALDTASALLHLRSAKELAGTMKPREVAKIDVQLAGLVGAKGKFESALGIYRDALKQLLPDYRQASELPPKKMLYAENTLKEIFDGMASIYIAQELPEEAIVCYNRSFLVEEHLKENFNYKESKLLQQTENRGRAEMVLSLLHGLYLRDGQDKFAQRAFAVAEQTKSIALKDELRSRKAWMKSTDTLYRRKKRIDLQLAQVENALVQEQGKGEAANISSIQRLINTKNELSLQLKQLKQAMGLEVDRHLLNVDSLQLQLRQEGLTLIEYFFGQHAFYTFVLDGQKIRMIRNHEIDTVRKVVTRYSQLFTHEVKINAAPELFAKISQRLYNLLIPTNMESSLLVVPDGLLNFVPFEALLTSSPTTQNYADWPWLLKQTPVFYHYSADLYASSHLAKTFDSQQVLGFFPEFANTDRFLSYSKDEGKEIQRYFDGDFLSNEQATKQNFLKNATRYPIIHLSTHASAGSVLQPPSISFIDSALYLPEIYGLDMHTELMVLGACETGIGKLYRGEGPLSIASGFMHAGVENIMLSLWKVNDYSTAKLMSHFYKNYARESRASSALHQAKLDYLKDEEIAFDKKSPYYWASFVYYGDHQRGGEGQNSSNVYYILIALGLTVLLSFLAYRFRSHSKNLKTGSG